MDASIERAAPLPGEGFKRGFVVMTFSPKFFGGAAEFSSASIHLANAVKDVFAQYEADRAANASKLPVISCTGSQPMKDKFGTNYRPSFVILKWVDRPAELPNESPVAPSDIWQGSAASTAPAARAPAQHVAPPQAKASADPLSEAVF